MNRLSARLLATLTALLAAAAGQARADYLGWTYTASPSVSGITVGTGANSASVTLTDYTNKPGALSIPVVAYTTVTNSPTPVDFTGKTYGLTLTITDTTKGDHGVLSFTGTLSDKQGLSATTSDVQNSFSASTPTTLSLDGHVYTVSIPTVTLVDPTKPQGNILATVSVADAGTNNGGGNNGGTQNTPEPGSLVLAGLGFSFLGAGRWWKRRSAARAS